MGVVRIDNLRKTYGKGDVVAIEDLSLEVGDGEMVVLLGPSGCGKTTTLRSVAGLLAATSGRIEIGGRVVYDSKRRIDVPTHDRNFGMVFQSYALWPHKTVANNVRFPLQARKVPRGDRQGIVSDALRTVQCDHLADRFPGQLSGGQQQRVALARALVGSPELLLLDEPLSNLDALLRLELRMELRSLHRRIGFTGIYVTHDQSEALALATRIVVMQAGRIEQVDVPESVFDRPASTYVASFLGARNRLALEPRDGVWVTPLNGELRLPDSLREYECVELLARSEWVRLLPAGEHLDPTVTGMVDVGRAAVSEAVFGGSTDEYVLAGNGVTVHASVPREWGRFEVGQDVAVVLPADKALLYADDRLQPHPVSTRESGRSAIVSN